jgi:leucyl/phenylalanyl-tRNA--protein transferase
LIHEIRRSDINFPSPHDANEDGIVAWGGDLHPLRIIKAYQSGIFPWYSKKEPILWWSPDPRLIMELDEFKISHSLKKSIKKFEYKFDTQFEEVMRQCALTQRNNQDGTWIQEDIIQAYTLLHQMGYAHSVESYFEGKLVGGLYGLSIGGMFCGESMFSHKADASKSSYAILVKHLKIWGYSFIDCQVPTNHLKSLGAREINREEFLEKLEHAKKIKIKHSWELYEELQTT